MIWALRVATAYTTQLQLSSEEKRSPHCLGQQDRSGGLAEEVLVSARASTAPQMGGSCGQLTGRQGCSDPGPEQRKHRPGALGEAATGRGAPLPSQP